MRDQISLSRRRLLNDGLSLFAAAAASLGVFDDGFAAPRNSPAASPPVCPLPPPPGGYAAEAARLTALIHRKFWDAAAGMYRAPVRSAETVDSDPVHDHGYTFWPSLLGLHTLIEGERSHPGTFGRQIAAVYAGLARYYDADAHAYDAWLHFPGNADRFYDDNAWAVITLTEAFRATHQTVFRDRAAEIQSRFLGGGWDSSGHPGGVRWGTNPKNADAATRTTSATAGAALAALMLARVGVRKQQGIRFAREALDWLLDHLLDRDGLIRDGLQPPDWTILPTKWTYNTGVPIRAYVELFHLTGDHGSLSRAESLAKAAIDHHKGLYDGLVTDPERKFYYDSSFFVHYLIDGLLELYKVTGDPALLAEARRNANFAYWYVRDPGDGLYFRNWRLWRIDERRYQMWRHLTDQNFRVEADDSERSRETRYLTRPVTERPLVKTLLANAGIARLFWLLARAEKNPPIAPSRPKQKPPSGRSAGGR